VYQPSGHLAPVYLGIPSPDQRLESVLTHERLETRDESCPIRRSLGHVAPMSAGEYLTGFADLWPMWSHLPCRGGRRAPIREVKTPDSDPRLKTGALEGSKFSIQGDIRRISRNYLIC